MKRIHLLFYGIGRKLYALSRREPRLAVDEEASLTMVLRGITMRRWFYCLILMIMTGKHILSAFVLGDVFKTHVAHGSRWTGPVQ